VFRRKAKGLRSRKDLKERYFPSGNTYNFRGNQYQNNWILTGNNLVKKNGIIKQNFLPKMSWVNSTQHIKIKGNVSSFNDNHFYLSNRIAKYSRLNNKSNK
jgi:hypothetical protein